MSLSGSEAKILLRAVRILEKESFVAKLTELTGEPVSRIMKFLPRVASAQIHKAVRGALNRALEVALTGLDEKKPRFQPSPWMFNAASSLTGGASGFFGMAALAVELPVTTVLILRSIAGIARQRGENLKDPAVRLACLEVLALTPRSRKGKAKHLVSETSYYAARAFLAKTVSEAAAGFLERGVANTTAPVIVDLLSAVAPRFGVIVSEKAAAGAIPIVGAIGGAAINVAFMDHFQKIAWAHFAVRQMERRHGSQTVKEYYEDFLTRQ